MGIPYALHNYSVQIRIPRLSSYGLHGRPYTYRGRHITMLLG